MPKKIFEGLGPGTLIPQRGKLPPPGSPAAPQISAEEGFVLSRVDGRTSLEEICLLVPFEEPLTMVILRRLWEVGAIDVPGVARQLVPPVHEPPNDGRSEFDRPPTSGLKRRPPAPAAPPTIDNMQALSPPITTPPPAAPVPSSSSAAGAGPIPDAQRQRIDAFFAALDSRNAFELLEIDQSADDKAVKRAYFKLSKEFHPDRFFGKDIGEYKDRLTKIFQAIKAAFEVLSDKRRRAAYEESANLK
jgi:hypothetical protein